MSDHIKASVSGDAAVILVEHPDGGISEVQVYLWDDGLNVVVNTSRTNGWVITRDDVDVDSNRELI